ncbi:MAG: hypothetical protein KUG81_01780 [Gammaproteobacteria bacterium]|nr:hypothetical protein [Gammaproteobacteria bacterium]
MPIMQGTAYWAKVLKDPKPGYDGNEREWSIDIAIDKDTAKLWKEQGIGKRIKNKGDEKGDFVTLKRKEFKYDGETRNQPIRVVDAKKKPWDQEVLIGNGSKVAVNYSINDTKFGQQPCLLALQVIDLVEYEGGDREEFGTYNEDGTEEEWA